MYSVRFAHIGKSLSAKRFFNLLRLICIYAGFMRKYTDFLHNYSLLGPYLTLFSQFKTSVKDWNNIFLTGYRGKWDKIVICRHGACFILSLFRFDGLERIVKFGKQAVHSVLMDLKCPIPEGLVGEGGTLRQLVALRVCSPAYSPRWCAGNIGLWRWRSRNKGEARWSYIGWNRDIPKSRNPLRLSSYRWRGWFYIVWS